jgi:2-(3-amino-3-carboxypropyl)histidine synthase
MSSAIFDFDEAYLIAEIEKRKPKLVFVQLPEGLKTYGPKLVRIIKEAGVTAIVSADPCYGACDLATTEAKSIGADLIVHYGHSDMNVETTVPTLYIKAKAKVKIENSVKKAIRFLRDWSKIGLVTTIQHTHTLNEAKKVLLEYGKDVVIGDAGILYPGQVLGCNYSNAKAVSENVEAFLFIGGGGFHPLGLVLATGKPTIVADPYEKRAYRINTKVSKLLRIRWANIQEMKNAKEVGVLIGLKPGQKRVAQALEIKRLVEESGRNATLFALREVTPEALLQFPTIEGYINMACPRLSIDNTEGFRSPLLTPKEALVVLGKMRWDELCKGNWFEN